MAHSSALNGGENFAPGSHIMFDSLDFLSTAVDELRLADLDMPVTTGTIPAHSTMSKAEMRHLKRHVVIVKRALIGSSTPSSITHPTFSLRQPTQHPMPLLPLALSRAQPRATRPRHATAS
jgi:hypothetical protein